MAIFANWQHSTNQLFHQSTIIPCNNCGSWRLPNTSQIFFHSFFMTAGPSFTLYFSLSQLNSGSVITTSGPVSVVDFSFQTKPKRCHDFLPSRFEPKSNTFCHCDQKLWRPMKMILFWFLTVLPLSIFLPSDWPKHWTRPKFVCSKCFQIRLPQNKHTISHRFCAIREPKCGCP